MKKRKKKKEAYVVLKLSGKCSIVGVVLPSKVFKSNNESVMQNKDK
jgi:hypothetical protein